MISSNGKDEFPATQIYGAMARRAKSLTFGDEEIDELLELPYGNRRTFALLALLFPFVDTSRHHFHVDHVFPRAQFKRNKLRKSGVPESEIDEFIEMMDSLPNLQLLEGVENIQKQASLPGDWLSQVYGDGDKQANYCRIHMLGDIPDSVCDFRRFYTARRSSLRSKISQLIG